MVKVYLVTRLSVADYSFLLLENSHPKVVANDLGAEQMFCVNKKDFDRAISLLKEQDEALKDAMESLGSGNRVTKRTKQDFQDLLVKTEEFLEECE